MAFTAEPGYSYQKANLHLRSLKQVRKETMQKQTEDLTGMQLNVGAGESQHTGPWKNTHTRFWTGVFFKYPQTAQAISRKLHASFVSFPLKPHAHTQTIWYKLGNKKKIKT